MTRSGTDFYVVWVDESNGNFEIYLRRWNGSAWETAGGNSASGGGISNTSGDSRAPTIYVAPNGKVYVAWYDNTTGDYEIYVRGLTGGTWQEVGLSSASAGGISANAGASSHPIVKTSPGNIPVVAWADDSGGNYEIYVLKYPNP